MNKRDNSANRKQPKRCVGCGGKAAAGQARCRTCVKKEKR